MGHKAEETTSNMNNAFGPGIANKYTVQWWFQKFCKGDESLEDEKHSGQLLKLMMANWKLSSELILLQLHEKLPKNSTLTFLSCGIWRKLERWKSAINGSLLSWSKIKEIIVLKCHVLLFCETTMNHFSIGQWHMMKDSQWWPGSVVGPRSSKALPKARLHQKKVTVPVWWSAACLIHYSFLNPSEIICETQWNREGCSANWWDALKTVAPTASILTILLPDNAQLHNQHFKTSTNLATKFCLICHIHMTSCQPTTTS